MAVVDTLITISSRIENEGQPSPRDRVRLSRSRCCRYCCRLDDLDHFLRVRQKWHVARLDLRRRRADALGVKALEFWINRPIIRRDDVPRRDRFPRSSWNRCREDRAVHRFLSRCHHTCVCRRDVLAEHVMKLRAIGVKKARGIGYKGRAEGRRRELLTWRFEHLICVGGECRDVDQGLDVCTTGSSSSDHCATIGVPNDDNRTLLRIDDPLGRRYVIGK